MRNFYILMQALIALFTLFVSTWIARVLARQISGPIAALLRAADEVGEGNLNYRVEVGALDELAGLVHGFNEMTRQLQANRNELETRRRFTEAILESIPNGVISVIRRRLYPESESRPARRSSPRRRDAGAPAGGSVPARRRRRDPLHDEARAPHRIRLARVGSEDRQADAALGRSPFPRSKRS